MKVRSFGITDKGIVRPRNEDAIFLDDRLGLYAVADGMGGHKGGEIASNLAVQMLKDYMEKLAEGKEVFIGEVNPECSRPANHLASGIRYANRAVHDASFANPAWQGMGTTVAAVLLNGNGAAIAHVGDSRVYLLRGGEFRQLTEDHSMINEQLKMGLITKDEAEKSTRRNVITRALGQDQDVLVDVREIELADGDRLILCSDGLHGMLSDEVIAGMVSSLSEPTLAGRALLEAANHNGGNDNISVVIVSLEEEKGFVAGIRRMFTKG